MEPARYDFGTIYLRDNILFLICADGLKVDLKVAKAVAAALMTYQKDNRYPLYVDISEVADTTKEGRDFMASEVRKFSTRCAFFSRSAWGSAIANFYLKVSKPLVPTKLFDNEKMALEFLAHAGA